MADSRLRGVILDVDGTLVDSNDAHARAWRDALREHGIDGFVGHPPGSARKKAPPS